MRLFATATLAVALSASISMANAEPPTTPAPEYDAALAKKLGADEHGMRRYVLVILKSGPTRVPDGDERKAMFAGHFANMERLSKEGKLAMADGEDYS